MFVPPLPKRTLADFPQTTSRVRDRQQPSTSAAAPVAQVQVADVANLLHSAALGELAAEDVGKAVRDAFDALSSADVAAAVQAASSKLMNRAPTGEYWGSGDAAGTGRAGSKSAARALTQYQMVHRLVETKLNAHKKLLEVVNASVRIYNMLGFFLSWL